MVLLKLKKSQLPLCSFFLTPTALAKNTNYYCYWILGFWKVDFIAKYRENCKQATSIILNEFGDSSVIEKSVTIQDQDDSVQEWLDIGNGCLCCTVKDNGVTAIENLIEKF